MDILEKDATKYPAVDLAYIHAVASYDAALKRLDVVDSRLQTLLTLGVTLSLAVVPVAGVRALSFRSGWFYGAALAFVAALVAGSTGRLRGRIMLLHPTTFYEKWLHLSEWEFKKNFIFFAGQHFEANCRLGDFRARLTNLTALFFLVEWVLVAVWAAVSFHRP